MKWSCMFTLVAWSAVACGGSDDDGDNQSKSSQAGGDDESRNDGAQQDAPSTTPGGVECAAGYTCADDPDSDVIWVMKNDGNVNGPTCARVCEAALPNNCDYHACDDGRTVDFEDLDGFAPIADRLGFSCREGGCWWPDAPSEGLYLVSIATDDDGTKSCFFPTQSTLSCGTHPGNANCFGERYAAVCPCVPRALDEACQWECGPHGSTRATWNTQGSSCVERINYWRKRACEEGWIECPAAGLPPMVECTACHECTNSEANHDSENGAHASFKRCGETAQGEGGGKTCADVIDAFVSERAPDDDGVMRCQGHCGPILAPGCRSFSWGKAQDSGFHTLNWGGCNAEKCEAYCDESDDCYSHETSPSAACDAFSGEEPNPEISVCE